MELNIREVFYTPHAIFCLDLKFKFQIKNTCKSLFVSMQAATQPSVSCNLRPFHFHIDFFFCLRKHQRLLDPFNKVSASECFKFRNVERSKRESVEWEWDGKCSE